MHCSKFSEKWNLQLSPTPKAYYLSFINCVSFPCSFVFQIYEAQVKKIKYLKNIYLYFTSKENYETDLGQDTVFLSLKLIDLELVNSYAN